MIVFLYQLGTFESFFTAHLTISDTTLVFYSTLVGKTDLEDICLSLNDLQVLNDLKSKHTLLTENAPATMFYFISTTNTRLQWIKKFQIIYGTTRCVFYTN